ncbi:MAG TPA: C39 family peptidase, partial [Candidatus Paceibacterota bacterium]|nr:C39 family peptidase [Candidatus Paceibacterota bacterium]
PPPRPMLTPQNGVTLLNVPFTSQAPFGGWSDPRQENGCEEAAALMAVSWARGQTLTSQAALDQILAASDFEQEMYGNYIDTSVDDTVQRIFKEYFHFSNVQARHDITIDDIKEEIFKGNIVLIPVNGRQLDNPHYTAPGPLEHMLVIRGYDAATNEFITNDPGTRFGQEYRYSEDLLYNAAYDYGTGDGRPVGPIEKNMIVVSAA